MHFLDTYNRCLQGQLYSIDYILIGVTILLLLSTFFKELNIFGLIGVKNDLIDIKRDLLEINKTINISSNNQNQEVKINNYFQYDRDVINKHEVNADLLHSKSGQLPKLDSTSSSLVAIRVQLENKLQEATKYLYKFSFGYISPMRIVETLMRQEKISNNLYGRLKEIIAICNNAAHGKPIENNAYNYVVDVYDNVYQELKEVVNKL